MHEGFWGFKYGLSALQFFDTAYIKLHDLALNEEPLLQSLFLANTPVAKGVTDSRMGIALEEKKSLTHLPRSSKFAPSKVFKSTTSLIKSSIIIDDLDPEFDVRGFSNQPFYSCARDIMLLNSIELEPFEVVKLQLQKQQDLEAHIVVSNQEDYDERLVPVQYTAYLNHIAVTCSKLISCQRENALAMEWGPRFINPFIVQHLC